MGKGVKSTEFSLNLSSIFKFVDYLIGDIGCTFLKKVYTKITNFRLPQSKFSLSGNSVETEPFYLVVNLL